MQAKDAELMSDERFLLHVPFYQGLAWSCLLEAARRETRQDLHEASRDLFVNSPRYFALCELARQRPEEYRRLVQKSTEEGEQRYGAVMWEKAQERDRMWLLGCFDPLAAAVVARATTLIRHWEDQDGFNSSVIDALGDAVRALLRAIEPAEPTEDE